MKPSIKVSITGKLRKISTGSYVSEDVKMLYVDLRDYSRGGSITREIGDYIAHPRAKDRGISHVRASQQFEAFKKMGDLLSGRLPGQSAVIEVKPAFTSQDIVEDLIVQMRGCSLLTSNTEQQLRAQVVGVSVSVICLLQDATIKVGGVRLSVFADFSEGMLSLLVGYPIDYKGRVITAAANLIAGLFQSSLPSGMESIRGRIFSVEVVSGVPRLFWHS